MTHTYYQLLYHFVWSTKERLPLILPSFKDQFYAYIGGIFKMQKCHPLVIGGMPDHIHLLVEIPPNCTVAELVCYVKVGAAKWLHETIKEANTFQWQEGYGAFTVSSPRKSNVIKYIQNQETHHKKVSFEDEFLWLLKEYGIGYDPQYLWK